MGVQISTVTDAGLKVANSIDSLWYIEKFSDGVMVFSAYCMLHKDGFWWFAALDGKNQITSKLSAQTPTEDLFAAWAEYARLALEYADN